MLIDIVESLHNAGITEVVCESSLLASEANAREKVTVISDARSACFYAFGRTTTERKHCALIVDGNSLPCVYTGMTEAWFQKSQLIIIGLYKSQKEVKVEYLERCSIRVYTDNYGEVFSDSYWAEKMTTNGPILINIIISDSRELDIDYSSILVNLETIKHRYSNIFVYGDSLDRNLYDDNIHLIHSKYKYGVVSKYIGFSIINANSILCCPLSIIALDLNVFRTRYKTDNMKMIVVDDLDTEDSIGIIDWIGSNGWRVVSSTPDSIASDLDNNSVILVVKENRNVF